MSSRITHAKVLLSVCLVGLFVSQAVADPCGMVPPIYNGPGNPITRIGEQQTYVFYKNGIETFVIRPGFRGKVDQFGMLIPFPTPPAIRKVPDNIFPQVAAAVDPPEVVIDLRPRNDFFAANSAITKSESSGFRHSRKLKEDEVRVLKQEAVGMYEVAVLAAGSADALKKWMDKQGFKYPDGMDKVCNEYIDEAWCFVAVKTKVGQKKGVDPRPGQRKVNSKLPAGSTFDGFVQAMGFRFKTDKMVVPMRLSAFNDGELRNIVYLLTDGPRKIRSIPEEYVMRQLTGKQLIANVTQSLPLRILGGTEKDLKEWHVKNLKTRRDPTPKNGAAKELFAADLLAVSSGTLSLPHEEQEKQLLAVGERLGLRGGEIDKLNAESLKKESEKTVAAGLKDLDGMTLTVVDGDFPREVLGGQNLTFAEYKMPARRNNAAAYDAKTKRAGGKKAGILKLGHFELPGKDVSHVVEMSGDSARRWFATSTLFALFSIGIVAVRRRRAAAHVAIMAAVVFAASSVSADPCGMVPPIYNGPGNPITRIGEQQTYVFYKDGIESIVIRPGFRGKVEDFGMLIPFPTPPAIRKMPDNIFPHVAAAVDPPEVVIDVRPQVVFDSVSEAASAAPPADSDGKSLGLRRNEVRVLREEAVGMYEVAVLAAGSPEALKKWMEKNGYQFPKGMDKVCNEYIKDTWCFVAVKTKVADKKAVDARPGQRRVKAGLPSGSTFDGHVQAMGFRFKTKELVVPMRLSAFNDGELRNIVYLLTDGPRKIRSIPEEYVMRQIQGKQLVKNVTDPLPLRIIGGTEKDLNKWHLKGLKERRDPTSKNGAAKELFAADLHAVSIGKLSLPHEEQEKQLLSIGERLGLRGGEIDKLNAEAFKEESEKTVAAALKDLDGMTLTVVDGDFPREVLGGQNLTFAEYKMPARRNNAEIYNTNSKRAGGKKQGILKLGQFGMEDVKAAQLAANTSRAVWVLSSLGLVIGGIVFVRRRRK